MTSLDALELAVFADPEVWIGLPPEGTPISAAWLTEVAEAVGADEQDDQSQSGLREAVDAMRAGSGEGFAFWFAPSGRPSEAFVHVRILRGLPEAVSTADLLRGVPSTVAPQVDPLFSRGLGVSGQLVRTVVQDWSGDSLATWIGVLPVEATGAIIVSATSGSLHDMAELAPHFSALVARLAFVEQSPQEEAA
ncbi:hypothetical protein [Agrococcus casei]|uniref:hypothetical protein n=1 Tax=Agrococcus casei TaxID=343512 RepID=UPI003F929126